MEDRIEFDGRVRKLFSTIAGPFALLRSSRDAKALVCVCTFQYLSVLHIILFFICNNYQTLYHETKALAILNSSVVLEAQDGPDPPQQGK